MIYIKIQPKSRTCKTTESYKEEVKQIAPFIQVLEEYQGSRIKIKHYCKKHNIEWEACPTNILRGHFCKECGKEKNSKRFKMSHEEYIQKLKSINPNIICLEQYQGINNSIQHKCSYCGYVWKTSPSSLVNNKSGCPNCSWIKLSELHKYTKEQYVELIKESSPNIILLGDYINSQTPTLHKCLICGYEWNAYPCNLLKGHACKKCASNKLSKIKFKGHEQFIQDFKQEHPNSRFIDIISEYSGARSDIICKCLLCNKEWKTTPDNLLNNKSGCPFCSTSLGEKEIKRVLDLYNISYIYEQKYGDLRGVNDGFLSYDFYLPNYNKLIEYQGYQHYYPIKYFGGEERFEIQQEHDKRKREYALKHNIDLLEIRYDEYDDIEKILINNLKLESLETAG